MPREWMCIVAKDERGQELVGEYNVSDKYEARDWLLRDHAYQLSRGNWSFFVRPLVQAGCA